jgi:hypothetical protein
MAHSNKLALVESGALKVERYDTRFVTLNFPLSILHPTFSILMSKTSGIQLSTLHPIAIGTQLSTSVFTLN